MGRSRFATTPRLLGGLVAAGACLALASGASGASVGGDAGDNRLNGSTTGDLLRGLAGSDVLRSLEGNDRLVGGTGNDRLRADTLHTTLLPGDHVYVATTHEDRPFVQLMFGRPEDA